LTTAGTLPPGLTFDSGTGTLSGTPTAAGHYSFTVENGGGGAPQAYINLVVTAPAPPKAQVERQGGADRYATAAALATSRFAPGTATVFLASGTDFPDALAGAQAAAAAAAPILLTAQGTLPAATASALKALRPGEIVILGGTATISSDVERTLASYTTGSVTRIAGADRYATAAASAQVAFPSGAATVFLASGVDFPDGLVGVPAAWHEHAALLLTATNSIPAATAAALNALRPSRIVVLGGVNAVGAQVATAAAAWGQVTRVAGSDRYATAVAILQQAFTPPASSLYVTTGQAFPDALGGAVAAAESGSPLLLTMPDALPPEVAAAIQDFRPSSITVLGGTTAIDASVAARLAGMP
jgi:putative cell wall-binding protein